MKNPRSSLGGRSEVQISGQSNRTQCCQRFATAATILQKKLCYPGAMTRRWAQQTRYTLWRVTASIMKDSISYRWSKSFADFVDRNESHRFLVVIFLRIENHFCAVLKTKKFFLCSQVLPLQIFRVTKFWLQPATKMCYVIIIFT